MTPNVIVPKEKDCSDSRSDKYFKYIVVRMYWGTKHLFQEITETMPRADFVIENQPITRCAKGSITKCTKCNVYPCPIKNADFFVRFHTVET